MVARPELHRKRVPLLFVRGSICSLLILAAIAAALLLVPDADQRAKFSDVISAVIDALAAALLLAAARASLKRSRIWALAWGLLALAGLLYAAGDGTWAYLEAYLSEPPFPSLADVFYLAYYP